MNRVRPLAAAGLLAVAPAARAAADAPVNATAVATFLAFVAGTLAITWWAARRTRSKADFYTAGGRIGGLQNGFAIAGDFMSAAAFLGMAGLTFVAGYDAVHFYVGLTLGWAVILLLMAERLRNLGHYTFADVVSLRLERRSIRTLSACATLAIAIPYLLAQLVAAGTLVQGLFGVPFIDGVVAVGVLMTAYVIFGGMLATTWVQIVKAILLVGGGTVLALAVLAWFDFSFARMTQAALDRHPRGAALMAPGGLYPDWVSIVSLSIAFIGGTAGLPHVLMRFFTVPDAAQARRSAALAMALITYFNWIVFVIGLGAVALLVDHPHYTTGGTALAGGSNMAAIHLSAAVGGDVFLGFISAVAFATIVAVVSGITLSVAATVSHDLYSGVLRDGHSDERAELRVSRVAVVVLGVIAMLAATRFEGQNVAVLATMPLSIAASVTFPVLMLAMYWRGLTTRGALWGGYTGLAVSALLVVLGPTVWVPAFGFERPLFPWAYPTLFSLPVALAACWWFSLSDASARAGSERAGYDAMAVRAEVGPRILERLQRKTT